MGEQVLVAYATKHGATGEIAARVGQVLHQAGLPVKVLPVGEVDDLGPYRAVVLGSAVYAGQWRKAAADFLQANQEALAQRAVWLFSSGPTGEGDPAQLMNGWRFPAPLEPVAQRIGARDTAFFHGALDPAKLSLGEKLIVKGVKAPLGDFRDWGAIESWAAAIAAALQ